MHRLFRIGMIVTLIALAGSWVAAVPGVSAQGTTWTDSMDAPNSGLLSGQSPDPAKFSFGYQNSQFIIQSLQQGWHGDLFAYTNVPDLTDANVAVDFSIAGDLTGKYAFVGCRDAGDGTGYMVEAHPDTGRVNIWRYDPDTVANLATVVDTTNVHLGSANNRIEISCQGSTISGMVNGQVLVTAQDATYTSGSVFIGAGKDSTTTDLLLTGFDNLSITDLSGSAPAQPTQPSTFPTAIPAQPTQPATFPTAIPAQPTTPGDTGTGAGLTDPRVDPDGTLTDALVISLLATPVGGPLRADDTLVSSDFKFLSSGVDLSELYTSLSFVTPPAVAGSWIVGFAFWVDGQGGYTDVYIQATNGTAKWAYGQGTASGYQILQSGDLAPGAVDFTPGAENYIGLVVAQGMAILTGNDMNLAASVDLGGATGSGDVQGEVGFRADDPNAGLTLPVSLSAFRVWDLSPAAVAAVFASEEPTEVPAAPTQPPLAPTVAAPPVQPTQAPAAPTVAMPPAQPTQGGMAPTAASTGGNMMLQQIFNQQRANAMAGAPVASVPTGTLQQAADGFGFTPAGVALSDFYATATFVNPTDMTTRSDTGIGFRDINDNMEFRFVVRSDGEWALAIGTGLPVAQGTATNFDATPGASNTLEVMAIGSTGLLAVNGVVVQQVDLSADLNMGDVWIATGMYATDSVDGRQVPFTNFAVYSAG